MRPSNYNELRFHSEALEAENRRLLQANKNLRKKIVLLRSELQSKDFLYKQYEAAYWDLFYESLR